MARAQMARWKCPSCGSGVLAPTRPRKDDVRRYCLECSKRTGRLVERVQPAAERRRERKAASRKAAPARAAERQVEAALIGTFTAAGDYVVVDMLAEVALAAAACGIVPPRVKITRRSADHRASGMARPRERTVRFAIGEDIAEMTGEPYRGHGDKGGGHRICAEYLRELALHEVAHIAAAKRVPVRGGRGSWHGPAFKRLLLDAARRRWPDIEISDGFVTTRKAYDLDFAIVEELIGLGVG